MSNYSEYLKKQKVKDMNFFFGEGNYEFESNKYFKFKHFVDDNNIIINTANIKIIKNNYIMLVDNDKAIYLKDWQVKKAHNFYQGIDCHIVKLNRMFFKPYQFKFNFDGFAFEKEVTFDDLVLIAKEQDTQAMSVCLD